MLSHVLSLSALICAILAVRAIFRKRISPRIIYGLWLLVLLRVCVPGSFFTVQLPNLTANTPPSVSAADEIQSERTELSQTLPAAETSPADITTQSPTDQTHTEHEKGDTIPTPKLPDIKTLAVLLWVSGSAATGIWFAVSGIVFSAKLRKKRYLFGQYRNLKVFISPAVKSPFVSGIFPSIYLSPAAADSQHLAMILEHEYVHKRQGDHIWAIVRIFAVVIYWWNPFIWLAARFSALDAEFSCDFVVSQKFNSGEIADYARTMLDLTPLKKSRATGFGSGSVKERINMLTRKRRKHIFTALCAILIALLATGCAYTGISAEDPDPSAETECKFSVLSGHVRYSTETVPQIAQYYEPLSGGALTVFFKEDYYAEDYVIRSLDEGIIALFDEEEKTLYPVCALENCDHTDANSCIIRKTLKDFNSTAITVYEDTFISIGHGGQRTAIIAADYVSLDGSSWENYEFDLTQLIKSGGDRAETPMIHDLAIAENTVYIDVYDKSETLSTKKEYGAFNRWIVAFDMETREYRVVANYPASFHNDAAGSYFIEIADDHIIMCNELQGHVKIDLNTGEFIKEQCPGDHKYGYSLTRGPFVTHNGLKLALYNSVSFDNQTKNIHKLVTETEKGLIFTYLDNNVSMDSYVIPENGEEVTYTKNYNMVYVTKDDYFDGSIDSPWYYDPETNIFTQE